jgi:16S rRNA (guanine(966)-N(2))-methyltransferase RsmD
MRVIAGRLRGRRVDAPKGSDTRPTYDRVRESVFAIIGPAVEGAAVLDLFAGSGVLSIESISRGARAAVLVEADPGAVAVIERNVEKLGVAPSCTVRRGDALKLLERGALGGAFGLVFVDPPYRSGLHAVVLGLLGEPDRLPDGALVVVEHEARDDLPESVRSLTLVRRERYGSTAVSFYEARPAGRGARGEP